MSVSDATVSHHAGFLPTLDELACSRCSDKGTTDADIEIFVMSIKNCLALARFLLFVNESKVRSLKTDITSGKVWGNRTR